MPQRKPRSRKASAASSRARAGSGRVGPLWWGAGILALGWIAFDANRPLVERHVPQLADLRMPWQAPEPAPARRETPRAAPVREAAERPAARPASPRPAAKPQQPEAPRTAALRAPVPPAVVKPAVVKPVVPVAAPRRGEEAPGRPAAPAAGVVRALPTTGSSFTTQGPTPLRRAPSAGSPVWMVLDAGRPLRVTRREGGFARVESGIFTGWVEAAVVPEAATAPPAAVPARAGTMPTLAAAAARRAGPVPTASVPAR
ncbi:SH3 domain-containing protein [Aureimonas sp. SK2]|uniref:SH3 domain-containing protein n=1 Tax=Aureimonas sp. SK2 TaxID=3015992 RepID=UPI0024441850|nr:SH3 domain-containing protein [Aureimonas sp. SK2]